MQEERKRWQRERENEKVYRTGTVHTNRLSRCEYRFFVGCVFKIVFDHHECNEQWKWCFKALFFSSMPKWFDQYTYTVLVKRTEEEKTQSMLLSQFYSEFNSNYMRCDIVNISINNSDDFDLDEMSDKKILMNVTGSIDTIKKRFSRKKREQISFIILAVRCRG